MNEIPGKACSDAAFPAENAPENAFLRIQEKDSEVKNLWNLSFVFRRGSA
jgi:hypothetical protein